MISFYQFISEEDNRVSVLATHGYKLNQSNPYYYDTYGHENGTEIHVYHKPPKCIRLGCSNPKNHDWEFRRKKSNDEIVTKSGKGSIELHDLLSGKKKEKIPTKPMSDQDRMIHDFFAYNKKHGIK
jgi:hypothetical protein